MTSEHPWLFVYGTLRQGVQSPGRAILKDHAKPAGQACVDGELWIVDDLPALVAQGGGTVVGDLYHLVDHEAALAELDAYEGATGPHPGPYRRKRLTVGTEDAPVEQAWGYVWTGPLDQGIPIPSGDYLAFLKTQGR